MGGQPRAVGVLLRPLPDELGPAADSHPHATLPIFNFDVGAQLFGVVVELDDFDADRRYRTNWGGGAIELDLLGPRRQDALPVGDRPQPDDLTDAVHQARIGEQQRIGLRGEELLGRPI